MVTNTCDCFPLLSDVSEQNVQAVAHLPLLLRLRMESCERVHYGAINPPINLHALSLRKCWGSSCSLVTAAWHRMPQLSTERDFEREEEEEEDRWIYFERGRLGERCNSEGKGMPRCRQHRSIVASVLFCCGAKIIVCKLLLILPETQWGGTCGCNFCSIHFV